MTLTFGAFCCSSLVSSAVVGQTITQVATTPELPTPGEPVTAHIYGTKAETDNFVEYTELLQSGNNLALHLHWSSTCCGFPVVTPYHYEELLEGFDEGEYFLTVRSFFMGQLWGWESTSFVVVLLPAPTDLLDFANLQTCFSGQGVPPTPACNEFDYDRDEDVDLDDHAIFHRVLTGPR